MSGSLLPQQLREIVEFIFTKEKDLDNEYEMPKTLVETGTFQGQTAILLSSCFGKIYTIEADPLHFARIFDALPANVYTLFGLSPFMLRELEPSLQDPCVFYLDAHWWNNGNITRAELEGKTALLDELVVIGSRPFSDLIIIDDSRLFGRVTEEAGDWSHISPNTILNKINHVRGFFERDDRFVIYKRTKI